MKHNLTCIICPKGCLLALEPDETTVTVSGNSCPKGREYGVAEFTNPIRTVTATIRVANRCNTMLSVKTSIPVSKAMMMDVMKVLRCASVDAPIAIGDVVLKGVCGSDIVATKAVL